MHSAPLAYESKRFPVYGYLILKWAADMNCWFAKINDPHKLKNACLAEFVNEL